MKLAVLEGGRVVSDAAGPAAVPWWSFTKTVIAAAVLRLVDQGRLNLDEADPAAGHNLRRLLQHTAGAPDYGGSADYHAAVAAGGPPWSAAELRRRVGADRALFPPGEGWAYSNIGYLILRERLEAVTGAPLGEALRELVLAPLGVEARLAVMPEDLAGLPGVAAGYHPGWVYHGLLAGAPVEAARLLDGLLGDRLLSPPLLAEMTRPYALDVPTGDRPWTKPGYGLGLMTPTANGRILLGHTGGGPSSSIAVYGVGGRAAAAFSPEEDPAPVERAVVAALG